MTRTSNLNRADCTGTGAITPIPINFPFAAATDLIVYQLDTSNVQTTLTLNVDYTVAGAGTTSGTVTPVAAIPSGYHWTVLREVDQTQETDIRNQGAYYPEIIEDALDKLTDITQQLSERMDRAVTAAPTSTTTLQLPSGQVGYALGWPVSADVLGAVPSNVALALSDFASSSSAAKGAGMVGYAYALAYGTGTVGEELKKQKDATDALDALAKILAANAQCRLVYTDATHVTLQPYNGNKILINGAVQTIPAAGVALASTGLLANTLYYVYAYMNGTTMTLEAVTTGHSTDATTGVEIKTGDALRTIVGMVYCPLAATFSDTYSVTATTGRFVASWFNRRQRFMAIGSTTLTMTNTAEAELGGTAFRVWPLSWADEVIEYGCGGFASNSTTASMTLFSTYNGAGYSVTENYPAKATGTAIQPFSTHGTFSGHSEGLNYVCCRGYVSATSTETLGAVSLWAITNI